MACRVHISSEFRLPSRVRQELRKRLEHFCAILDELDRKFAESISMSSQSLELEMWRFRYQYELQKNRLVVTEAVPS